MTEQEVQDRFIELCNTPSDISEHLITLRAYADKCDHITEFGVRGCVSLFAFLSSKASTVFAFDICNVWTPIVDKLMFVCADDLEIQIEETDFLFIDTAHNYEQCSQELELHGHNVRKYIGFHDTNIFGTHGDDGGKGLLLAIEEFMENNPEWEVAYSTQANNGLTIIEKK